MIRIAALVLLASLLAACPLSPILDDQRAKEREKKKDHNALCAAAMLNYSSHCSGPGGSQAASCSDDYDTCTFACLAAEAMIGCGF